MSDAKQPQTYSSGSPTAGGGAKAAVRAVLKKLVKGYLRNFYWEILGRTIRPPSTPHAPASFVFVCKGNICRSPFAQYAGEKLALERGYARYAFLSAGLEVDQAKPPPAGALMAAQSFGVDMRGHRSRPVTEALIAASDMTLAMEASQYRELRRRFPRQRAKCYLMPLVLPNRTEHHRGFSRYNIADPYGKSEAEFRQCFRRIEKCVAGLLTPQRHPPTDRQPPAV